MPRTSLSWITTLGLGHMRPFSGTWGSLPPVLIALALMLAGWGPDHWPWLYHAVLVVVFVVFSLACIVQGDQAEARWGKDPGEAVADETAGQCLPLLFLPASAASTPALAAFSCFFAFAAFRVFDIAKPWPCRQIQRVPAGWGILLDDIFAGLYALAMVQIIARVTLG